MSKEQDFDKFWATVCVTSESDDTESWDVVHLVIGECGLRIGTGPKCVDLVREIVARWNAHTGEKLRP
jgi:hypothetical protein